MKHIMMGYKLCKTSTLNCNLESASINYKKSARKILFGLSLLKWSYGPGIYVDFSEEEYTQSDRY